MSTFIASADLSGYPPMLTWLGLAAFVVFCIIKGWLVPRSTHQDVIKDRDLWRKAYQESEAARVASQQQNAELMEIGRTTQALVVALPKAAAAVNPPTVEG